MFIPEHPLKNQNCYEQILVDLESIDLTHIYDEKDPSKSNYSKCQIDKILSPFDWGQSIYSFKSFLFLQIVLPTITMVTLMPSIILFILGATLTRDYFSFLEI